MKDSAGSLKGVLYKWTEGRPRDLDVAAAILATAFRHLRCLQLLNRGSDNLSETERTDCRISQRCLRTSVKPKLFESELMHHAMEQWIAAMRNPKDAETLRGLIKGGKREYPTKLSAGDIFCANGLHPLCCPFPETVEVSQAFLVLESRRHAIRRILSQLPPEIMTPEIRNKPLFYWENAVHFIMADDARDCLNEGLYVPHTHPGRGRYPISSKGDALSCEAYKRIRSYMETSGLVFGKHGRFEWYLPIPVPSERTTLRPGVIVKGVIRPPAEEMVSSALTRM